MMEALGRQILVEFYDCEQSRINDLTYVENSLIQATKDANATIISHNFHKFSPYGGC